MNIVITGGTKGIGLAIARLFAGAGFDVAVAARTQADLEKLQQDFQRDFPTAKVLALATDMGRRAEVAAFAEWIKSSWPSIDVLINNAGLFLPGALLEEPDDHLAKMMDTNLYGPYHLTRALLPALLAAPEGHIFNICSVAGLQAYPNRGSYGITKFALRGFTEAVRMELRGQGVKVTAVFPGATWTDSWAGSDIPPERLIRAEDVAHAIYSAWATGPATMIEELVIRPQLGDV